MAEIREQIARGDYQVDPKAVADAIVRRLAAAGLAPGLRSDARTRSAGPDDR